MPDLKSFHPLLDKGLKFVPFGISVGLGVFIAGLCCLCLQHTFETQEKKCNGTTSNYTYEYINSTDYRNCEDSGGDLCWNQTALCFCNVELTVPKFIEGDVVISYTLDTFFDNKDNNELLSSRDDSQLSGNLNTTVSPSCASPYDYNDGKPIAPCGALADAMFTDTLSEIYHHDEANGTDTVVPSMTYGLLRDDDKIGFRNPPGDLETAFQNFSNPTSWRNPIWELDKENLKNNGFENEAFIIWMRYSELPIRPLWRLNRTANTIYEKGLPASKYYINMNYQYPHRLYSGPRTITLYREVLIQDPICDVITHAVQKPIGFDVGVAGVVIGVILLVISAGLVLAYKVKAAKDEKKTNPVNSSPQKSTNTTTVPNSSPEAIENSKKESGDSEETLLSKPPVISEEMEPEQKPLKDIKEEEEYL